MYTLEDILDSSELIVGVKFCAIVVCHSVYLPLCLFYSAEGGKTGHKERKDKYEEAEYEILHSMFIDITSFSYYIRLANSCFFFYSLNYLL